MTNRVNYNKGKERKEIQSMLVREEKNDTTFRFNDKGTEVYLIPYYQTRTRKTGSRTYFDYSMKNP